MAHKLAHSSDQKVGRGPEAFFREGDEPGFVQLTLRAKFLEAVEEVCPVALAEYQALAARSATSELGDALKEWATRYRQPKRGSLTVLQHYST